MDFTWEDWQAAQRMFDLYNKHRFLYHAYLFWLMLQSLVAFVILVMIVGFLILASISGKAVGIAVFTVICLISWIWTYFSSILKNQCQDMFLVDKRKYRKIYDVVNEISRRINGPKIHDIYIVPDFNAAATQRYIFTPFKRNILILGYPLLCAMSYRGLVGALAHEIGHIKHKHLSISTWVLMANTFWSNIQLGIITLIFIPWLKYWLPAFNKAIVPLYRQHEIEADKYIVKTFGEDYLAACQVEILLKEEQYSDVMDELLTQMRSDLWEHCNIISLFKSGLYEDLPEERDEQVINRALQSVPNVFDEHPSFAQRLELANCRYPMQFAQFEADALEKFVGYDSDFDTDLNAYFHSIMDQPAQISRTEAEHSRQWLAENPPSVETMNESTLIDALVYLEISGQKEQKMELLQQCVDAFPNFIQFRAMLALEHTKDDPDNAAAELEYCISQAPELNQLDDNYFLLKYYMDSGDVEKIHSYLDIINERLQQLSAQSEKELNKYDLIEAERLPQEIVDTLVEAFADKFTVVNRAYSVKRRINNRTAIGQSFIVLDTDHYAFFVSHSMNDVINELTEAFEGSPYHIVNCDTSFCDEYLEPIPGAKFYSKK